MSRLIAGRTFDYVLESERGAEAPDVFKIKVLSGEADDAVGQACREYGAAADKQSAFQAIVLMTIAAWPWEGSLRSVLTDRECWELVGAARLGASLTADERKKFVSPLPSETD